MNNYLNKLEFAILQEIFRHNYENINIYYLLRQLPFIKIKKREFTGVGQYVYFEYEPNTHLNIDGDISMSLSSSKSLKFDTFNEYFSYELDISNGRMNYIEIVTYKDGWDGLYNTFEFEE